MPIALLAAPRPRRRCPGTLTRALSAGVLVLVAAACSSPPNPGPSGVIPSPSGQIAVPTPAPTATPQPTPDYSNEPDPTLEALIPATLGGAAVHKPSPTTYGIAPGDIGSVFGEIGLRFRSLVVAYMVKPRLSLFAMRVDGPAVDTADLRPYLAAAARYVGVSGLQPNAWKAVVVHGNRAWMRGEDEATLPGTTFYCWSSGEYVFLITGSSDANNRAMVSALPGQPAPSPSPTTSPVASGTAAASPSVGGSATSGPTTSPPS